MSELNRDITVVEAGQSLRQLVASGAWPSAADAGATQVMVVQVAPDAFVAMADSTMRALWDAAGSARADAGTARLADVQLGRMLAALARPPIDVSQADAWAPGSDGEFAVVVEAGRPVGFVGEPWAGSLEQWVRANAPEWVRSESNEPGAKALPPLPLPRPEPTGGLRGSAVGADLDVASGGGPGGPPQPEAPPAKPQPSTPQPAGELQRENIRLDVATPESAVVDQAFDVAVAIRQPASPKLAIDDLTKVASAEGAVFRPAGQAIARYRVELSAQDCEIDPPSYLFYLERGTDSPEQYFQVTAHRQGTISLVVNAYQADDGVLAVSTRVRLKVVLQVQGQPGLRATTELPSEITLRDLLANRFRSDEIEILCADLTYALRQRDELRPDEVIDLEVVGGENRPAQATNLINYVKRRGWYADLVVLVMDTPQGRLVLGRGSLVSTSAGGPG